MASTPALAAVRAQIGHGQIPTIYPPFAQLSFAAVTAVSTTQTAMRALMVLADLGVFVVLWRWLAHRQRAPQVAILYLFSPLAVLESSVGGHVDALGVFAVVFGAYLLERGRPVRAGVALAVSIGVKLLPLLAIPMLVRRRFRVAAVALLVSAAAFGAYHVGQAGSGRGLAAYAHRWQANDGLFRLTQSGFEQLWPDDKQPVEVTPWVRVLTRKLAGPPYLPGDSRIFPDELAFAAAKAVSLALLGLAVLWGFLWQRRFADAFVLSVTTVLLVSPVVHPWYLLWVLPFAVAGLAEGARWSWAILAWSALTVLAYLPRPHYLSSGVWAEPEWVRWAEYVPVWGLLLVFVFGLLRPKQELDVALGALDDRPADAPGH